MWLYTFFVFCLPLVLTFSYRLRFLFVIYLPPFRRFILSGFLFLIALVHVLVNYQTYSISVNTILSIEQYSIVLRDHTKVRSTCKFLAMFAGEGGGDLVFLQGANSFFFIIISCLSSKILIFSFASRLSQ